MGKTTTENWKTTDKRILEKKLKAGEISMKEFKAYLRKLPDLAAQAEELRIDKGRGKVS